MLDLLIIHPGATHGIYGKLGDDLVAVEPPLWSRLIAGYVRDRGFSVKIIDQEALRLSPNKVVYHAEQENPRLICIAVYGHQPSASTQQMVGARSVAVALKNSKLNQTPIIMVGGHVSALPKMTMIQEAVDYACVGEGPVTIAHLLGGTETDQIPGLVWRDGKYRDKIYQNASAPLLDVKELHGNAWDLLPMEKYRAHNWQCFGDLSRRQPYASIYTSLGCPYKCSFCCINAPFESNQYRMRDPYEVVGEIVKLYQEYGVKTFKIVDEMFILNERHYTDICTYLQDQPEITRDINIWAYARVDTVKPKTLDMLRRAGFRWLALGIESGSKYVRDGANKRLKSDDIIEVVRTIQRAGINVIGNYIFGLPDDDYDSMQDTLNLALELNTEFSNFYSAMAYPGSKLYAEAVEKGWTLPDNWAGYSQHNKWSRPLDTNHISAREVLAYRDQAFQTYFTSPVYLNKIKYQFGDEALEHVQKMTRYKLERNLFKEKEVA